MDYCGPKGIELDAFLRWSRKSQDAALEWAAHEAARCRRCGTHPDDEPGSFHAHLQQCKGCQAQERAGEDPIVRQERGVAAVIAPYPVTACPRCAPAPDGEED